MLRKINDELYMYVYKNVKFELFQQNVGFSGMGGKCMTLRMTEQGVSTPIATFITHDDGSQRYLNGYESKLWSINDLLNESNRMIKKIIDVQYSNAPTKTADNYIALEPGKIYGIPIKNGVLRIDVSQDPNCPGIDVEYIDDNEPANCGKVRPRVLIESEKDIDTGEMGQITARVWFDPENENNYDITECEDYV